MSGEGVWEDQFDLCSDSLSNMSETGDPASPPILERLCWINQKLVGAEGHIFGVDFHPQRHPAAKFLTVPIVVNGPSILWVYVGCAFEVSFPDITVFFQNYVRRRIEPYTQLPDGVRAS